MNAWIQWHALYYSWQWFSITLKLPLGWNGSSWPNPTRLHICPNLSLRYYGMLVSCIYCLHSWWRTKTPMQQTSRSYWLGVNILRSSSHILKRNLKSVCLVFSKRPSYIDDYNIIVILFAYNIILATHLCLHYGIYIAHPYLMWVSYVMLYSVMNVCQTLSWQWNLGLLTSSKTILLAVHSWTI